MADPEEEQTQEFRVVFAPTVAVREHPDLKSTKIGSFRAGEVVQTLGWDASNRWRRVRIKNEWWQLVDGWVQVVSDHLGTMLEPIAPSPPSREQAAAQASNGFRGANGEQPERPSAAGKRSRFAAYAKVKGVEILDDGERAAEAGAEASAAKPALDKPLRSSVGQMYEVVYRPHVAVRLFPSLEAPAIRCARFGLRVELFEWDHSRQWRRVTTCKAVDADDFAMEEEKDRGTEVCDGWMLIEHPSLGPLLQAVAKEEPAWNRWGPLGQPPAAAEVPQDPEAQRAQEAPRPPGTSSRPPTATELEARKMLERQVLASVEDRPGLEEPRLMRAARAGSYEVVRNMLQELENPNKTDAMGETALFEAASASRTDIVGLLLLCMADPTMKSRDGTTVTAITGDSATLALIGKWQGEEADTQLVRTALLRLNTLDRKRVSARFLMPYEEPEEVAPAQRPEAAAVTPSKHAAEEKPAAPAAPPTPASPAGGAPMPQEDIELDENGVPKRIEVPTRYRVVYKMVAVRRLPTAEAPMIRAKKLGEVVDMFEWDQTRCWRRVRTTAPKDDETGNALAEMDGWMLIRSEKVGLLLQEIPPEEAEKGEDEEEEFAG